MTKQKDYGMTAIMKLGEDIYTKTQLLNHGWTKKQIRKAVDSGKIIEMQFVCPWGQRVITYTSRKNYNQLRKGNIKHGTKKIHKEKS